MTIAPPTAPNSRELPLAGAGGTVWPARGVVTIGSIVTIGSSLDRSVWGFNSQSLCTASVCGPRPLPRTLQGTTSSSGTRLAPRAQHGRSRASSIPRPPQWLGWPSLSRQLIRRSGKHNPFRRVAGPSGLIQSKKSSALSLPADNPFATWVQTRRLPAPSPPTNYRFMAWKWRINNAGCAEAQPDRGQGSKARVTGGRRGRTWDCPW
jgi:hypothetical protein